MHLVHISRCDKLDGGSIMERYTHKTTHKHAHTTHTHTQKYARTIRRYLVLLFSFIFLVQVALFFSFSLLYLAAYSIVDTSEIIGSGGGDTDDVKSGVVCVPKEKNECSCCC